MINATRKSVWPALEPLTPRGVAAYAYAPFGRLLTTQLIVALVSAAAIVWFFKTGWCPVVREAIRQLPDGTQVQDQRLAWKGAAPLLLAENQFLALTMDPEKARTLGTIADVRVQIQKQEITICSLFGCCFFAYPKGWSVALDRTNLEPWWGAREFAILAAAAIATMLALILGWVVLATIYFAIVYLIAYVLNRDLTWGGGWRLAAAALMPGALFLTLGIVIYGLQGIGLVRLVMVFLLHFLIGWIYIFLAPVFLARADSVQALGRNPFGAPDESQSEKPGNPFSGRR